METLNNISEYDRGWLMGFIEGEGSFTISLGMDKSCYYGFLIKASFKINLIETDRAALEFMRDLLNFGNIIDISNESLRKKGMRASDSSGFQVTRLKELLKLHQFLSGLTWRSKKQKDFELWGKALYLIKVKAHLRPDGILKICQLRDQMNNPGKKPKNYRTAEDIRLHLKTKFGWAPSRPLPL